MMREISGYELKAGDIVLIPNNEIEVTKITTVGHKFVTFEYRTRIGKNIVNGKSRIGRNDPVMIKGDSDD